jgi:hypothetical protein
MMKNYINKSSRDVANRSQYEQLALQQTAKRTARITDGRHKEQRELANFCGIGAELQQKLKNTS